MPYNKQVNATDTMTQAQVTVKLSNVVLDFSGSDIEDWNMDSIEAHYDGKIVEVEVENDKEYFNDYLIEALTDHISNISGWCVKDYDYEIVTVS